MDCSRILIDTQAILFYIALNYIRCVSKAVTEFLEFENVSKSFGAIRAVSQHRSLPEAERRDQK